MSDFDISLHVNPNRNEIDEHEQRTESNETNQYERPVYDDSKYPSSEKEFERSEDQETISRGQREGTWERENELTPFKRWYHTKGGREKQRERYYKQKQKLEEKEILKAEKKKKYELKIQKYKQKHKKWKQRFKDLKMSLKEQKKQTRKRKKPAKSPEVFMDGFGRVIQKY